LKTTVTEILPLTETRSPADQAELAAVVAAAHAAGTPVYPLGGGTSLDYGLPARQPGLGLSLTGLARVVDYPARDMTITVEAGIRLAELADILAGERQWLPVEGPHPAEATAGGLVATAWSGARRYGWGTMRDYVIGVSAVDGRGIAFKGGGRVVKNVAGYDFCKLLTGSCGTLAVITQLTLKLRPLPERSVLAACTVRDLDQAERLLAGLVGTATTPSAVELLVGPQWRDDPALPPLPAGALGRLVVGLEGTTVEIDWMIRTLEQEWHDQTAENFHVVADGPPGEHESPAAALWQRLREFSAGTADLALKASLPPSRVCGFIARLLATSPDVNIQAHAGNGIVIARFPAFAAADISKNLIGDLQPAAAASGHLTVLSSGIGELTHQCVWGGIGPSLSWMIKVKEQFDPRGLLNPGRFVYA
jgi:glycolate oxidase FAD binding subunit